MLSIYKFLFLATLVLSSAFVVGCTESKETIREIIRDPREKGREEPGGGGDCVKVDVKCIPFDKFVYNIKANSPFKDLVQAIILNLDKNFPKLAADFVHLSQQRTWYLIPVALDRLSSTIKGTHFESEQMAIQDLYSVFIDKALYEPLAPDSQVYLLVHELVMGVRLMQFQNARDNCLASSLIHLLPSGDRKKFQEKRDFCTEKFSDRDPGSKIDLEAKDYDRVRKLTSQLIESNGEINGAELEKWMKDNNFRTYEKILY